MVKPRVGVIWLFSILGLALIGFIMMGHYGNAIVFGVIEGDQDSQSSIETIFRFSNYPAKLETFSKYDDLERAFDRKLVDFVIYSYSREIDEQLHNQQLRFPNYPELLNISLDPVRLNQYLTSVQTDSRVIQLDIYFQRMVFDDYLSFLKKLKINVQDINLSDYQNTLEAYIEIKKTPQVFDYLMTPKDIHVGIAIENLFRKKVWLESKKRVIPAGILNENYLDYSEKNKTFLITIDSILRNRSYARPIDHPFMKLAEFASERPKMNCIRASELVNFNVDGNTLSQKASELQELLFEVIKNREQGNSDAVSERLNSTIICY